MKTNLTKLATLLVLCLLAVGARAGIILQDNFDADTTGEITNQPGQLNTFWIAHSGVAPFNVVADSTMSAPNAAQVNQTLAQDVHAFLTNGPYACPTGSPVGTNALGNPITALYASMSINVSSIAFNAAETYFTHFEDSGTFKGRVFIVTNGAASGKYRLAIQNAGTGVTNVVPIDLNPGTSNTIVTRFVLGTGICTLWVNPNSETNTLVSTNGADAPSVTSVRSYSFRQNTGEGIVDVDNLVVGTTFADVVPGSVNPPSVVLQPADNTTAFTGNTVTFTNLATGDANITYQWYYNTNTLLSASASVIGVTNNILTLTGVTVGESGTYDCVVSNAAGTNVTRFAALLVGSTPVPPAITNQPVATTVNSGDTATFGVIAGGSVPLAFQWKYVPATNSLVTNIIAGATATNLTLANASASLSGNLYFVTITNQFGTTNSAKALLTVNPPQSLTVGQLRSMVDPTTFVPTNTTSIYTIQGTVTTWTNMTTSSTSLEFYMQDSTAGIAVFWSGASPTTNLPPAGAIVRVTGSLSSFDGLVEIEPIFTNSQNSLTIISTNNPLPTPQPLVFDPNVTGFPGTAKNATTAALESMYFVASNVTLNLSTPTFVSGANDIITNNAMHVRTATNGLESVTFTNSAGQQFILFVNGGTDIPNRAKYTGPVTIYGILGYFNTEGFEFTPSRFADIVPYIVTTNVVSNVIRHGDLATNTFTENVLEPGETLTTSLSIGDPEGGTVTLSPSTAGLPADAGWSNVSNGQTGTAVFHFTPSQAEAGVNYVVSIGVTSTSGSAFSNSFTVYVPTAAEQQVRISEFLANPTTNSGAANFNPLHRSIATTSIVTNDEYIELVNQSGSTIDTSSGANGWEIDLGNSQVMVFDALGSPPLISSSNAVVIYGGGTPAPSLPVSSFAATAGKLGLPTSGTGTIILRNGDGDLIDRVIYSAGDISTNGSLSRFPTINGPFVPQPYISTNVTTAGLQYDGSAWNQPYKVPAGVTNVGISVVNGQVLFNFPANIHQANTLWGATTVTGPYSVLFGGLFPGGAGAFTNAAAGAQQFYYISTQ